MCNDLHILMKQIVLSVGLLCCLYAPATGQKVPHADSMLSLLNTGISDTEKVNVLVRLSRTYRPITVTKEFYYANEALSISEKIGWDKGVMFAEQLMGDCYSKVVAYNDAIAHYKRSIALAKKLKQADVASACLQYMVDAYHALNKLQDAVTYQKELLQLSEGMGDPINESNQMTAYAVRLSDVGRYREAIGWLLKNIAFARSNFKGKEQDDHVSDIMNTLAINYIKINKIDSSLYYLRTASTLAASTNNTFELAYITSTLCDVYIDIGKYDSAIFYGISTIKMGEEINRTDLQQHYYEILSTLYEYKHEPAPALTYHKKFDSLTILINSTQERIEQALQVTKINIEQQTEHNKVEQEASETIRHNQRVALIAALIAVVAFITLTILIYKNLRQKQKTNKTISIQATSLLQQNEIIDKALKEKEMLLKETHHRVKNNLQLISSLLELQAANMKDEHAKDALQIAQRRVLSIATVHSKLYGSNEDEAIEFSAFVSDLFSRLSNAFASEERVLQFVNTIPETFFLLNTVVILGLILNELITNSFKYAFADNDNPIVRIGLEVSRGQCMLRYYDNGKGLPDGVFNGNSGSLGLYLVRRMSKQLKGTVDYNFDGGSIFTINFPNAGS